MSSVLCWRCPSCGALVSLEFKHCPGCGHASPQPPAPSGAPAQVPKQRTPPWLQAVSVPTALLGIVAFFLPWCQLSCGPVRVRFAGYEMATGTWSEKIQPERTDAFWSEVHKQLDKDLKKRRTTSRKLPSKENSPSGTVPNPEAREKTPLLWLIPLACAALLVLSFFGLPRVATLLTSGCGSAYLAYFTIDATRMASDPMYTGGVLEFSWLFGFWASWVGLIVPAVAALARPRRS